MLNPRIRIVDDERGVRESISLILRFAGFETLLYETAEEFLAKDDLQWPGCIISDIRMPRMTGLELQQELNRRGVTLPILFLTAYADVSMAVMALKKGAADFMEKPMDPEKIQLAVQKMVDWDRMQRSERQKKQALQKRLMTLTKKEMVIARLIAQGAPNKDIAENCNLSVQTVKTHRANIYAKLEVSNSVGVSKFFDDLPNKENGPLKSEDIVITAHIQ